MMPPLAFTQLKYAWAMYAMSVNDVPGWLVTIPPRAIGVPDAWTPGFVPHCDVLTAEVLLDEVPDAPPPDAPPPAEPPGDVLFDELHAARIITAAIAAAASGMILLVVLRTLGACG